MKKRILVISVLLVLLVIPIVLSLESTITVKTGQPNKIITLRAADPETGKTFSGGIFTETADEKGEVVFNYNLEPVRIKMGFMAQNENGAYFNFLNKKQTIFIPNVILNKFVDIDLNTLNEPVVNTYNEEGGTNLGENITEAINETDENATEETEAGIDVQVEITNETEETETNIGETNMSKITGAVVSRAKSFVNSKTIYYILGGILILVILFFAVVFTRKKIQSKKGGSYVDFKIKKEDKKEQLDDKIEDKNDELKDAERKLREAQTELDAIKSRKTKLQEAKERFEKAKRDLKDLEG